MLPKANSRIRDVVDLDLPISEVADFLDSLGARRCAIVRTMSDCYLAWGTTSYIGLEQKLKDDDTYGVVVRFGMGCNALICNTAEQADKVARQVVAGARVTESVESRVVGTVDLGGEQVHNLYKLVSSEGFKPVPTVLTHGRGFTLFDDNGGTSSVTRHDLDDYLAQHGQFALAINNGWFYIAAISDDRNALERFARKLMKQGVVEESTSRIVSTLQTPLTGKLFDMATRADLVDEELSGTSQDGEGLRIYAEGSWKTIPLERFLDAKDLFAVVIVGVSRTIAMLGKNRAVLEKYARDVSKLSVANESTGRVVGRVSFDGSIQDADDISAKYGAVSTAQYCYTNLLGAEFHATSQRPLADLLDCTERYAVVVTFRDMPFAYMFADRGSASKFARAVSKSGVFEALKSDVTDLGVIETDKTITADKGGLRNYLRGKFNVLGINREVFSNYHHSYGGSAHDGEYYLPNSDAYVPLTRLADRLVTQRVFGPGTKSSDLAIVRFIHDEAIYTLGVRYVIGFKSAVEKLIRSVRSDAVKLEALPDPDKL